MNERRKEEINSHLMEVNELIDSGVFLVTLQTLNNQ